MVIWDMDGTIVIYVPSDYKDPDGTENYKFLADGYFLNREADPFAIQVFKTCVKLLPDDTYIVTGVTNEIQHRNRLTLDKMSWTNMQEPAFDIGSKFMAVTENKAKAIQALIGRPLTKKDILIDDYNKQLYSWTAAGGTAIKYINDYNSEWDEYCIDSRGFDKENIDCNDNKKMVQDAFHYIVHVLLEN